MHIVFVSIFGFFTINLFLFYKQHHPGPYLEIVCGPWGDRGIVCNSYFGSFLTIIFKLAYHNIAISPLIHFNIKLHSV